MNGCAALHELHAQLDVIASALDTDDLDAAGAGAAAYDAALRGYVEGCTPGHSPVDALRGLLRTQNALLLRIAGRRDQVSGELRQVQAAGRASRAYAAEMEG